MCFEFVLFFKGYIFLFEMKLEVLCPFSCCYIFYYKWLLSFSNEHTSVAEKLWLPGRKKKKIMNIQAKQTESYCMSSLPVKIQLLKGCWNLPRFFPLHLPLHPSLWEIPRHSSSQQLCPHDAFLTCFFS